MAANDLAPQLYGSKRLQGAPMAYVMEYLTPPSPPHTGGWVTFLQLLLQSGSAWTTNREGYRRHPSCA